MSPSNGQCGRRGYPLPLRFDRAPDGCHGCCYGPTAALDTFSYYVLFNFECTGCKHIIRHLNHDTDGPVPKIFFKKIAWPVYCGRQCSLTRMSCRPLCSDNNISDITNTECHAPHNRQRKTVNPHDAHRLVAKAAHVEATPRDIPCTRCC